MLNNDVLRRIRYTFKLSDNEVISIFGDGGAKVTRAQISDWLKKEDNPEHQICDDEMFATFLNGWIISRRGKKEEPKAEKRLSNNLIFKKIKIALNIKSDEILDILQLADFNLGKHELSAFFRKPNNRHFRECKDQVLRNFLVGVQKKYRPSSDKKDD